MYKKYITHYYLAPIVGV